MDSSDIVRQRARITKCSKRTLMNIADGNNDTMTDIIWRWFTVLFERETARYTRIMTANPKQDADENGSDHQNNPRAIHKFSYDKNEHDNSCTNCSHTACDHL